MVTFTLILKRGSSYYVLNVIIPVILLGILNVLTFVLPADSGEKIGYTITVFLSFSVFLTIISSELPRTSGSILGYYLIFQLVMGTSMLYYTTCIYRHLCHTDNISKIVSVAITRRNEDMKNIIISNVEMMSLQVISVFSWSSAVFAVLSEITFFREKHRRNLCGTGSFL
jgi:hypothetical protein